MKTARYTVCLLLLTATLQAGAQSIGDIEKAVRSAWDKQDAITADISMSAELPMGENRVAIEGSGTSAYLRDGERDLYRQDMTLKMPPPVSMEIRNEIVFDGDFLYLTNEAMGRSETMQDRPSIDNGNVPPGGGLLFDVLKEYMDLRRLEESTIDGREAYVIEGTPKAAYRDRVGFLKAIFSIDKATGFLMKTELFESPAAAAATITASNLNTSPELSPEMFRAPEGFGSESTPATPPAE